MPLHSFLHAFSAGWTVLRHGLLALAFALLVPIAHAEGIAVTSATIEPSEDGGNLVAACGGLFCPRLEEAVSRGVRVYVGVEFELARRRGWWFDE